MRKCFACDKKLGINPAIADTKDDQYVFVGTDCYQKIKKAGAEGYQPPLGGPRLWVLPKGLSQRELNYIHQKAKAR